jgi:hypothetical protein
MDKAIPTGTANEGRTLRAIGFRGHDFGHMSCLEILIRARLAE